jgi:hypothetical protein
MYIETPSTELCIAGLRVELNWLSLETSYSSYMMLRDLVLGKLVR